MYNISTFCILFPTSFLTVPWGGFKRYEGESVLPTMTIFWRLILKIEEYFFIWDAVTYFTTWIPNTNNYLSRKHWKTIIFLRKGQLCSSLQKNMKDVSWMNEYFRNIFILAICLQFMYHCIKGNLSQLLDEMSNLCQKTSKPIQKLSYIKFFISYVKHKSKDSSFELHTNSILVISLLL